MATYKVIQDIEAEDKLLGPLTLRQFIYATIVLVSCFIMFKLAVVSPLLVIPFLPHTILLAILASPIGKDQSPEIWLLAKIRFFLKPRLRVWDQSGIKELVTITVPKKIEHRLTNGLSQTEVKSRLQALANTIDSRGWAVKNVNVNMFAQPSYVLNQVGSDRLIDPGTMPQEVPTINPAEFQDMFDERSNATAQHLTQMISESEQARRQQVLQRMQNPASATSAPAPANYWFLNESHVPITSGQAAFAAPSVVSPGSDLTRAASVSKAEEKALLAQIHPDDSTAYTGHLKRIEPAGSKKPKKKQKDLVDTVPAQQPQTGPTTPPQPTPHTVDPVITSLASNNDLNLSTLSREANRAMKQDDGEVVIKLR